MQFLLQNVLCTIQYQIEDNFCFNFRIINYFNYSVTVLDISMVVNLYLQFNV